MVVSSAALYSSFLSFLYLCFSFVRPYYSDKKITSFYIISIGFLYAFVESVGDRIYYNNHCLNFISGFPASFFSEFGFGYNIFQLPPCFFSHLTSNSLSFAFCFDVFISIILAIIISKFNVNNMFVAVIVPSILYVGFYATFRLTTSYLILLLFITSSSSNLYSFRCLLSLLLFHASSAILLPLAIADRIKPFKPDAVIKINLSNLVPFFCLASFALVASSYLVSFYNSVFLKYQERLSSIDSGSTGLRLIIVIILSLAMLSKHNEVSSFLKPFLVYTLLCCSIVLFFPSIYRIIGYLYFVLIYFYSSPDFVLQKVPPKIPLFMISFLSIVANPQLISS